jgi:hypothetical protein
MLLFAGKKNELHENHKIVAEAFHRFSCPDGSYRDDNSADGQIRQNSNENPVNDFHDICGKHMFDVMRRFY